MKRISGGQLSRKAKATLLSSHAGGPRAATGDTSFTGQAKQSTQQSRVSPPPARRTYRSGPTSPPKPPRTPTVTAVHHGPARVALPPASPPTPNRRFVAAGAAAPWAKQPSLRCPRHSGRQPLTDRGRHPEHASGIRARTQKHVSRPDLRETRNSPAWGVASGGPGERRADPGRAPI